MRLEDEIKQKEFRNEFQKTAVNIIFTFNWLDARTRNFMKDYDLTPQQFNILRILRGQYPNPSTINLLKERMLDKMSDASRLVERLRIKELLERSPSAEDRRSVNILISQKGLDLLAEIDKNFHEYEKVFNSITIEDAKILNQLLDKLRD
ncbi:MAG: MarR family transcriptional regulator [Sporocytophaga sp.]|uniref:MarR family winged helix-turn-helix transcriptional regulator n=1 Tax=Sporocytophaga sp. TaxID=2231183 RepID=UPI001B0C6D96|nr:MarR family transcriptional regulator [Sporocytophaga sp.]MBO9701318.1 MarR family transcriptional regulator [Sporocytophaga sp.]